MTSYRDYIEYSEKYIQQAKEVEVNIDWLLIPSTILSWSAIESFVNNMLDDFSQVPEEIFQLHERALLLERKIRFIESGENAGKFILKGTEYKKLDDKILFLISKFGIEKGTIKSNSLWQDFMEFKSIRDNLVHPRRSNNINLSIDQVEGFLEVAKKVINLVSTKVWKKNIEY